MRWLINVRKKFMETVWSEQLGSVTVVHSYFHEHGEWREGDRIKELDSKTLLFMIEVMSKCEVWK